MRIILAILIWAAAASFAPAAITVTPGGGGGVITTNEFDGSAITSGTVADARIASTIARDSEVPAIMATNIAAASTNAQYAAYSNFRLNLQTNPPSRLIMDDDGEDIDGLIQHAAMLKLMDYGEVELLAITKANTNEFSVGAVEVVNRFYGYGNIPIGVRRDGISYSPTMSWETNIVRYNTNLCTYLYNSNAPNAVVLMRKILANSPDNSVDFLVGGQSFNIYALFNSTGDSISSKTGAELIFTKARDFYVIAGDYPSGVGDHNFATSPSTAKVWHWIGTTNSANRVIYVTISLGTGTATGGNYVNRPPYDPLYQAATNYIQAIGGSLPRPAWGSQGVLAAVRGTNQFFAGKRVFSFSVAGTNNINSGNGNNTFYTGSGNQFYLTSTLTTGEWDSYVNGLFDQVPMITQAGATVRRDGDKMTGKLAIGVSSTNALSVGTNTLIVDTVTNKVMIGEARDGANNPIINARVEIIGSNATATVETEVMQQYSRSTGAGVSFAQGVRVTLGRYKTPTSFSGDTAFYFEVKTDNSSLLGSGATWQKVIGMRADGAALLGPNQLLIQRGSGSPESVVTAPVGSMYLRENGGASTTFYIKESGAGNTGWIAK